MRDGELAGEQFISYREGSRLRELLNRAAREANFDPQVMLESNESQADPPPRRAGHGRRDPAAI